MSRERAARIEALFQRAADLPRDARVAYLATESAGDDALLEEVRALLDEHDHGTSGILSPRPARATSAADDLQADAIDDRYRMLRVLGEGGLGVVWLAEQLVPLRRFVAIKLIKPGMDTRQVLTRFDAERQVLALMDHPGIAHVYDAGVTRDGRPYFVMEYVPGAPLVGFCDAERLTTRERLELFVQACDAVHHAHRKGIIHRDIKPSNILVGRMDDRAVAKIIDFGIAKAITAPVDERSIVTVEGQVIGTPAYMSPEQADGRAVDSTTDVYSLGVTLYELLTGELPFDPRARFDRPVGGARPVELERETLRPSSRIAALGAPAADRAANRSTDVKPFVRALRGDLDWIVMKAIEREPERRYASASELGADIRRHLEGETIGARPPGLRREAARFMRRHRVFVGIVAMTFVALAIGVAVAITAAHREARLRATAEWNGYRSDIVGAAAALAAGNASVARRALDGAPERFRDWEWRYLDWKCDRSLWTARFDTPSDVWTTWFQRGQNIVGVDARGGIHVRDAASGAVVADHANDLARVGATASPDGRFVVMTGDEAPAGRGVRALWDVDAMSEVWRRDGRVSIPAFPFATDASAIALATPDATRVFFVDAATGLDTGRSFAMDRARAPVFIGLVGDLMLFTDDDGVRALDARTGDSVWRRDERSLSAGSLGSASRYVLFSGRWQQRARIVDARTGDALDAPSRLDALHDAIPRAGAGVLALQSDGAALVLVDAVTEHEIVRLTGHSGSAIDGARFLGDGSYIGSVSDAGEFKLWSAALSELPFRVAHGGAARAVHAATHRSVHSIWGALQAWDTERGTIVWSRMLSRGDDIEGAAFSATGDAIVVERVDGPLLRLDASDGRTVAQLADPPGNATCLAWTPDGTAIVAGAVDGSVHVCDSHAANVTRVLRCHDSAVRAIAFSPDGRWLATGSDVHADGRASEVRIWHARTGELALAVETRRASALTAAVTCLAFDAGGRRLAIGSQDGSCEIVAVEDGRVIVSMHGDDPVSAVRFMGTERLAVADRRPRVHVHDVTSGARLLELELSGDAIDFHDDRLVTASFGVPVCVAECTPPACGDRARSIATSARTLVDGLPREFLLAADIERELARLDLSPGVAAEVARCASERGANSNELNSEAWNIARARERPAADFELGLRLAERADALWPEDWGILNTLAVLQLRLRRDAEAIETAARSDGVRERAGRGPHPTNLTVVAMARWRRGEFDAARAELAAARALAQDESYVADRDVTTFLEEASALVAP